ncbi:MAG: phosphoribosylanthranilate isomerase [Thermoanaerobaculia bacterium]
MTGVKICGLTLPEDVAAAAELGAAYVGFNCSSASPRRVDLGRAAGLVRESRVARRVGVFVDEGEDEIRRAIDLLSLDLLQFHRDLRPSDLEHGRPAVAVSRVAGGRAKMPEAGLLGRCRALLLDTADPKRPGGTGMTFDWALLDRIARPVPVWLAGGLNPENVNEAIARARPEVVDVASGVESAPGIKDRARLEAFFLAVRSA